jgi:hypothetical protein
MKQISRTTALLLLLMAGWFTQANVLAQAQPVFLRLKGVGVGSTVKGHGTDVQVVGNFAYLAWGGDTNQPGGVEVYCVTNPVAPLRVGGYESPVPVNAIQVVGQYAYLAEGTARTFTNDPGVLEIIDVSDQANPVSVGSVDTAGRANEIRVAGNFAYVAESTRWTGTNLLGALEIFDVSTPTNPVRAAMFDTAGSATSVDVSGGFAFLADGVTDLQVLDVSNPGKPQRVGIYRPDLSRCAFEPLGPPNDFVQSVGNLAYSAGGNGLNVLDITNPSQPVRILDNGCIPVYSLHLAGHYAFVTTYHSWLNTFVLHIADTTNPTNWVTTGWKADWQPTRMEVLGNLIYVATNPLSVYEISDRPTITSLSINADSLILTWDYAPGFVLQRTASLANPQWSDVPGSEGQTGLQLPVTSGNEFFRLARP